MANRKVVRPNGLPVELWKILADVADSDTLISFHDV